MARISIIALGALVLSGAQLLNAATPMHRLPEFRLVLAQMQEPAGPDSVRATEQAFLVQGLENSRSEVEVSKLAVSQAASSEIRDIAQQLVTDFEQMSEALEAMARRKTVTVPVQPTSFSDTYRVLGQQSGSAFDRAYLREIASANQKALRLCEATVANAKDSDIRELAGNLLPVIRDHVNKITDLQKSY